MVSETFYTLIVYILTVSYTLTFGYCMYKTNKFNYFNDEWRQTKIFYISVIIQAFLRMTTYSLLTFAVPKTQRGNIWIAIMRSIPDTLFFVNYTLLVYQSLNIFYHSHMENDVQIYFLQHFTRSKFSKARKILLLLVLGWLGFMGLIYALMLMQKILLSDIDAVFCVFNLLSGTFVLLFLMYLYSNYSETPFKSVIDRENLQKISAVLLIWTLGRYFKGFLGLLNLKSASLLSYLSNPQESTVGGALMFIAQNFVSEIFCFVVVMDYRFINIFISQDQANMEPDLLKGTLIQQYETLHSEISPFITKLDVSFKSIFKKKPNGLGVLHLADYNGYEVLARVMKFQRISGYVESDIRTEIEVLNSINDPNLINLYAAIFEPPEIVLITPYTGKSLFKILHEDKKIISLTEKLNLIKEIGLALKKIHDTNRFHGHLTSSNVIISEKHGVGFTDYGLLNLKKYAGIVANYVNKSLWSSPEVLAEPGNTVVNPAAADDVYSFGVIVWEVITGDLPLDDLDSSNYREEICNGARPRLPEYFPKDLTKLLNVCWTQAQTRASLQQVNSLISTMKLTN